MTILNERISGENKMGGRRCHEASVAGAAIYTEVIQSSHTPFAQRSRRQHKGSLIQGPEWLTPPLQANELRTNWTMSTTKNLLCYFIFCVTDVT